MFSKYKSPSIPSTSPFKPITLDTAKPLIEKMLQANETGLVVDTSHGHETLKDMLRFSIGYAPAFAHTLATGHGRKYFSLYTDFEIVPFVEFLNNHKIHCRYIPKSFVYGNEAGGHFNSEVIGNERILEFKDFTDKNQLIDALNKLYPSPDQAAVARRFTGAL